MRYGMSAVVLLVLFLPTANAQTLDQAKLRQLIELPALNTAFGVDFRSSERDGKGNLYDPHQKIADLQKKLTGTADDGEIYLEMRAVYLECVKDEKKAKEAAVKAEAALRPHANTADPKQGHFVVSYATTLEILMENPWSDCERWARRAVSVSPNDWRTWAYLAHARNQQMPMILSGNDKSSASERRPQEVIGNLILKRYRSENVDAAEKALDEALSYHNKAKELAPNEPKRQVQRYGFRLVEIVLRNAIEVSRDRKAPFPKMQLDRVMLDELQETARLHPDHLLWQSQLVHQLMLLGWHMNKDNAGKASKEFKHARPEDRAVINEALGRIEKLADASAGETAFFCYSMLGALNSSLNERKLVEKYARKMLQIDAKSQLAWEQLQQSLVLQNQFAEQLEVAQAAVKVKELEKSSRNWFLLAKALVNNQHHNLAEQACMAGLQRDPNDAHCILGMAALMLRKGDDAVALKFLDRAALVARPKAGETILDDLEYLSAIHQAVTGEMAFARIKLQRMQVDYPDSQRYSKALAAFGR